MKNKTHIQEFKMERAALFVDFENLYYSITNKYVRHENIPAEVVGRLICWLEKEKNAAVVVRRVYAPFNLYSFADYVDDFALKGIVPVHVLVNEHKNSSDLSLSIDLMETLISRPDITMFVIVGGDRDYIPIAEKVRQQAKDLFVLSMSHAMSGDLRTVIGADKYIDPQELFGGETFIEVEKKKPKPPVHQVDSAVDYRTLAVDRYEYADWESMIKAACDTVTKFENSEVWLSPFLTHIGNLLPLKSREECKSMVHRLADLKVWRIENRDRSAGDGTTYAVLLIHWEHPLVVMLSKGLEYEPSAISAGGLRG